MKHAIITILLAMSLSISSVPVSAYNVEFDITTPGDPTSPRSQKDDNVQFYYVTGNEFSHNNVALRCRSYEVNDNTIVSRPVNISSTNTHAYEQYITYIPQWTWCAMKSSSSVYGYRVKGKYCP